MSGIQFIILVILCLVGSFAMSDSTTCSNSEGTLRYKYTRAMYGNKPTHHFGSEVHIEWTKSLASGEVQVLAPDAYTFDLMTRHDLVLPSGNVRSGYSVYFIKAAPKDQPGVYQIPIENLICTNRWTRPE